MAGTDPRFSATRFRDAMRFVFQMAAPEAVERRVTFRWETERTFDGADPAGDPYFWDSAPLTTVSHADVQIDCVVEFSARPAGSRDSAIGQFDTSRAVITLLDEDIASIQGADTAIINGNTYDIQFEGPAIGLFEVTLHQIFCEARDES
jgi:hypothetical protein